MQNKSSITRGRLKDELKANPVFAGLTDTQQNSIIDDAVREAANYRILSGKNDYLTDTNADYVLASSTSNDMMNYLLNGGEGYDENSLNFDYDENKTIFNIDEAL